MVHVEFLYIRILIPFIFIISPKTYYDWRGELHCVVSHKSIWLFPLCQWHQRPMSGIPHSCLGCASQVYSLWTVKLLLSKAKFWLEKVDSQLARLQDLIFGNQETRQLELWNLAQWEILSIVPGKVLWRKFIGGLGAKINWALMLNHCRSPSPWMVIMVLVFRSISTFHMRHRYEQLNHVILNTTNHQGEGLLQVLLSLAWN